MVTNPPVSDVTVVKFYSVTGVTVVEGYSRGFSSDVTVEDYSSAGRR